MYKLSRIVPTVMHDTHVCHVIGINGLHDVVLNNDESTSLYVQLTGMSTSKGAILKSFLQVYSNIIGFISSLICITDQCFNGTMEECVTLMS